MSSLTSSHPPQSQYEADATALDAQFESIEQQLKAIQADCQAVREAAQQQRDRVEGLASDVEQLVDQVKQGEQKAKDDLREIRQEVDVIRQMVPTVRILAWHATIGAHCRQMMEKNKENSNAALLELQQELKSLKTLLGGANSRTVSTASLPTASLPGLSGRPSIPSWQLTPACLECDERRRQRRGASGRWSEPTAGYNKLNNSHVAH